MVDLINKKKSGAELTERETDFIIRGYLSGEIPDYQMSAMLMAICLEGMTREETLNLTMSMLRSGEVIDLSSIPGVKADKHSTGGVGDKISLALMPMLAACGVKTAKMAGRGLGYTGGTIDKLESIPGFTTSLSGERFLENVRNIGLAIAGQSRDVSPADKMLYALRDVTGTVDSKPLIVSSIMSKKLASGADMIVLDVKSGSGAFMKTDADAISLAEEMVAVGRLAGKRMAAIVTNMEQPLGRAVGNSLEVIEAIDTLRGDGESDVYEICFALGECVLTECGIADNAGQARELLRDTIKDGSALERFAELIRHQDGDPRVVYDAAFMPRARFIKSVPSAETGYVYSIDAEAIGLAVRDLGGGRTVKGGLVDGSVGLILRKKAGDAVSAGEFLAEIHANDPKKLAEATKAVSAAVTVSQKRPPDARPVRAVIR